MKTKRKTMFTNENSVLIDANMLMTDLDEYCHKMGIFVKDFMDARNITRTAIVKSLRTYWLHDKGVSEKEYTRLFKEQKIPASYAEGNKIGRIKIDVLNSICKGIKKKPETYYVTVDFHDGKAIDVKPNAIKQDFSKEITAIQEAVSPLLQELKLMNTYLEKLCLVWEA